MLNPVCTYLLTVATSGSISNAVQIEEGAAVGLLAPYISGSTKVHLLASDSETGSYVPVYEGSAAARWYLTMNASGSAAPATVLAPFVWMKVETDIAVSDPQEFMLVTKLLEENRLHGWYGNVPG